MPSHLDFWIIAVSLAIALPSCRKATNMNDSTSAPGSTGNVPAVALSAGFVPAAFAAGRYAVAIKRTLHGTHALQVLGEDSMSSFVLELTPDGAATACRGWGYLFRNDGPDVQTEDRYREQQGYRGRYAVVDGIAEVELEKDPQVCAPRFEGTLALARASTLKLRCLVAAPPAGSQLSAPVLLCQSGGQAHPELGPYLVDELMPPAWFALGSGNGLRVSVTGRPPGAQEGEDLKATAKTADAPLAFDAWEHPF
jgi:hypothetical protein